MTLAITCCSSVLSCPYRFHDMLVRSVALLIIDAIGFKLYVRKFVDAFRFVMAALCNRGPLYFCPVVSFFFFYLLFFPRLISAAVDWMSAILLHMAWP